MQGFWPKTGWLWPKRGGDLLASNAPLMKTPASLMRPSQRCTCNKKKLIHCLSMAKARQKHKPSDLPCEAQNVNTTLFVWSCNLCASFSLNAERALSSCAYMSRHRCRAKCCQHTFPIPQGLQLLLQGSQGFHHRFLQVIGHSQ